MELTSWVSDESLPSDAPSSSISSMIWRARYGVSLRLLLRFELPGSNSTNDSCAPTTFFDDLVHESSVCNASTKLSMADFVDFAASLMPNETFLDLPTSLTPNETFLDLHVGIRRH